MRLKNRELQDRLASYEAKNHRLEGEKKGLQESLSKKNDDIVFLNKKIQQMKEVNAREVAERKKLDTVIEQQYREAMNLDQAKRKAEEDR